ncbi:MAG: MarR family transcriptional regulator [Solirubrobacterales bacterium]|nr:MarR family transcriptional regulator [Solirubrobacterales bacterium]MBV9714645.1 MarR family transcriptional regulator [Solirubrobacterales bacterium]
MSPRASGLPEAPPRELAEEFSQRDAARRFGQSFKAAMAALRRMRGREGRRRDALSDAQYGLLFALRAGGEARALSASELACAADLSPASVTEMLDVLAEAGLVRRSRSEQDRRVVLTGLTERGSELVEARRREVEPRFEAAMAQFSDEELRTAAAVLDRLRAMFDEFADEHTAT